MGTRYHLRCTRSHMAKMNRPLPPLHLWKNYTPFSLKWEYPDLFAIEHHDSVERRQDHLENHVAHALGNFEKMVDEFPPGPFYGAKWRDLPDKAEDAPRPHWAELYPYDGQNDPRPPPQPRFVIPDLEKEADERHARQVIVQQAKEQQLAARAKASQTKRPAENGAFTNFDLNKTFTVAGCPPSAGNPSLVGVTVTQHPCDC